MLAEVADGYRASAENVDLSAMSRRVEIGASQAIEGTNPAESLYAASVLFETALPFVLHAFSALRRSDAEVALVLHRVIMRRIASNPVSYTGFMIKTIRDLHRAGLARLARDLHDRTAHTIGMTIQSLELHEVHAGRDQPGCRKSSIGPKRPCGRLWTVSDTSPSSCARRCNPTNSSMPSWSIWQPTLKAAS